MNPDSQIVFIDDQKDMHMIANLAFKKAGFNNVQLFSSGKDALAQIKNKKPELVITDFNMPEMDGIEVLNTVKNIDASILVFILSGDNNESFVNNLIKNGADKVLDKNKGLREVIMDLKNKVN